MPNDPASNSTSVAEILSAADQIAMDRRCDRQKACRLSSIREDCECYRAARSRVPHASNPTSDRWTAPLCHAHHLGNDSPHGMGDETRWAAKHGINLVATAIEYWERSARERRKAA